MDNEQNKEKHYEPITLLEIASATKKRVEFISKEFSQGFEFLKNYPKSVTFFGSARTKEGDIFYEKARDLGRRVVEELRYSVITGGGPGIMEAGNRGAFEAGGNSLGLNIELPQEQKNNPYLTDSIGFHYFFSRKVCLSFCAEAYIFFPGGYGTLDEFLEILTLVQTKKIYPVPIILFGSEFWNNIDKIFKDVLFTTDKIEEADTGLYTITDDPDEVLNIIKKSPIQIGKRYLDEKHADSPAIKNKDLTTGPISDLSQKHCVPCEGGTLPLSRKESEFLLKEVSNWTLIEEKEIEKNYIFKDFREALQFMNDVGRIAENEGHHPDLKLHNYKEVNVRISTHAIDGLSENDFILAAKIDDLIRK